MIPYGRHDINQSDIDAVINVLKSDFLTQGALVPQFEKSTAEYCGSEYALAVNSATSALHIACLALELGPGDILWTTPNTFVASANCGLYCGADVDFVDIDPATYNLCADALEVKLLQSERDGTLPKVVVPVHFAGQSCDMRRISELGRKYGFRIIEDASHAIGAKLDGSPVGGCKYSDITVFSYHPVKIITTAEGGMLTTNDSLLYERLGLLRSHSVTRDPNLMEGASEGPWYYQQVGLGFNYRMTELQAALGVSQMDRLDEFVARRNVLAHRYDELLVDIPVTTPSQFGDAFSAYHLYPIQLQDGVARSRREVFDLLRERGIGVNVHYIPVHMQPHFRKMGFKQGDFPNAELYYSRAISIPLYYGLNFEAQDFIVESLEVVAS